MAGNAITITPDVLMRVRELTAAGFKCKDLASELSVTERKIYSLIERNIEFARAVAEGKKAFSDAEKIRKAKGAESRAAAKHTAEVKLAPSVEAQRVPTRICLVNNSFAKMFFFAPYAGLEGAAWRLALAM